ncbi:hypothetical protein ACNH6C_02000 [Bdellovibrio bacteriovorus]|uniref:hypothetical protein n=1 Tax=Bdellovibrio bacteriovorus TaxID=959 RepID=UPI003A80D108
MMKETLIFKETTRTKIPEGPPKAGFSYCLILKLTSGPVCRCKASVIFLDAQLFQASFGRGTKLALFKVGEKLLLRRESMKKKIVLAMAIIMVLGSVKAMAEEHSQEDIENQLSKIEATREMNERLDAEENEFDIQNQLTKTYAAEDDIKLISSQIRTEERSINFKLSEISKMRDSSQPRLNTEIERVLADAVVIRDQKIKEKDLHGLKILSSRIENAWQSLNEMDERNEILGVRKHPELKY